jgi:glycosyltransferase involved in cell wall biosynthesis
MKKYNILILIDSLLAGGAEKVSLNLSMAFLKRGHSVTLINLSGKAALPIPEELVVFNFDFTSARKARKYANEFSNFYQNLERSQGAFDFVLGNLSLSEAVLHHSNVSGSFLIHCILSKHLKNEKKGKLRIWKRKLAYRQRFKGRQLIFCSNYCKIDAKELFHLSDKQCNTIHNPIDVGQIQKLSLQMKPEDLPNKPYIINVGSFTKVKRHDRLIHAYKQSGIPGDLVLIGVGPEESSIRELVFELGLEKRVHFLGHKDNPYVYMRHAELFISSSDSEALPTVIIEALICETFVVATATLGAKEILEDFIGDALCEIENTTHLSGLIHQFYLNKPEINHSKIYSRFSSGKIVLEYEKIISSMGNSHE